LFIGRFPARGSKITPRAQNSTGKNGPGFFVPRDRKEKGAPKMSPPPRGGHPFWFSTKTIPQVFLKIIPRFYKTRINPAGWGRGAASPPLCPRKSGGRLSVHITERAPVLSGLMARPIHSAYDDSITPVIPWHRRQLERRLITAGKDHQQRRCRSQVGRRRAVSSRPCHEINPVLIRFIY